MDVRVKSLVLEMPTEMIRVKGQEVSLKDRRSLPF
jgi:hypothetical protein